MTSVVSTRHHHVKPVGPRPGAGAGDDGTPLPPHDRVLRRLSSSPSSSGDTSAVCQVMGDILHRVEERVTGATCPPAPPLLPVDYVDDVQAGSKHRKKSRRHRDEEKSRERKRKRSTSCSTASSTCSSMSSKKHKKKKKKHRRAEDPPSPRVNPIFLWVKQDNTKIVEVLCEDYDKRNRITLTKTAAGWRAIPRTERLSRQSSYQQLVNNNHIVDTKESEDERVPSCEPVEDHPGEEEDDDDEEEELDEEEHEITDNKQNINNNFGNEEVKEEPGDMQEKMSEDVSHEIPEEVPEEMSEEVPDEMSEEIPDEISEEIPEEGSEEVSEEISNQISEEEPNTKLSDERSEEYTEKDDELEEPPAVPNEETTEESGEEQDFNQNKVLEDLMDKVHTDIKFGLEPTVVPKQEIETEPLETEPPKPDDEIMDFSRSDIETEDLIQKENTCEADKCCEMNNELSTVDENHNNEYEDVNDGVTIDNNCLLSKIKECTDSVTVDQLYREVDECVEKGLKDLIDELDEQCLQKDDLDDDKHCNNEASCLDVGAISCVDKNDFKCLESQDGYLAPNDCDELMEELEEMCHGMMNQRLKTEESTKKQEDIEDVYTFVPTPENDVCKVDDECYNQEELNKESAGDEISNLADQIMDEEEMSTSQYEETNSPINLVVENKKSSVEADLKTEKCEKICESLEPSLDILWRLPEGTTIHHASKPVPKSNNRVEEAMPAHQNNSKLGGKFSDILNIPQPRVNNGVQDEPLDLGKAKSEKKPPPSLNEIKPVISPDLKKMTPKLEDITLTKILNKQHKKSNSNGNISMDAKTKSKLLELLTSETLEDKLDPLAQLKEVLSDPTLTVPDPLLVPRARLPALVANPAKEIPRLLSQKPEKMTYPKLDPDLLVVSLAHLQSLLQNSGRDEDLTRLYQQQAQMLQSQLKQQEHGCLDTATANALNQMLWLPYLDQLQAAAAVCGNNKDIVSMLNMVFPPYTYVQNPYLQQMSHQSYDYNATLLSAWQEAVQKPQSNAASKTESSKKYDPYKMYLKPDKKTTSRTSPVPNKYQQQRHRNNGYHASGAVNGGTYGYERGVTGSRLSTSQQQFLQSQQRQLTAAPYHMSETSPPPYMKSSLAASQSYHPQSQHQQYLQQQRSMNEHNNKPSSRHNQSVRDCNRLHPSLEHTTTAAAAPTSGAYNEYCLKSSKPTPDLECVLRPTDYARNYERSRSAKSETSASDHKQATPQVPKLKVKDHLVDPNARPKLLKFDDEHMLGGGVAPPPQHHSAAAVAAAAAAAAAAQHLHDQAHTHLWHPLFSSHQGKSYSSPWQWTTPVTVSGE